MSENIQSSSQARVYIQADLLSIYSLNELSNKFIQTQGSVDDFINV